MLVIPSHVSRKNAVTRNVFLISLFFCHVLLRLHRVRSECGAGYGRDVGRETERLKASAKGLGKAARLKLEAIEAGTRDAREGGRRGTEVARPPRAWRILACLDGRT
jgi:hypothetical protein